MTVDSLRYLDQFIGKPLCWALAVLSLLSAFFRRPNPSAGPRKILIIKLSEMGSTVLAYPAISELKRCIPDIEIFFLVFERNRAILDELRLTHPSNILTVPTDCFSHLLAGGLRALRRLRLESIDSAIDMEFFSHLSTALAFLVCRGRRVGFHRFDHGDLARGRLLTHKVAYSTQVHTCSPFMSLARAIVDQRKGDPDNKGQISESRLHLPSYKPHGQALGHVRDRLRENGVDLDTNELRLVLVNANSSDLVPLRRWPMGHFADFCVRLIGEMSNVFIVLTGTKSDQKDAARIMKRVNSRRCVTLAGATSFPELLALYSLADLMVTNDSGPAHFTSLVRLPALVLFGPETPRLYAPLGDTAKCLSANFACSPCVSAFNAKKSSCRDNRCLKALSVETVLWEALKMLKEKTPEFG